MKNSGLEGNRTPRRPNITYSSAPVPLVPMQNPRVPAPTETFCMKLIIDMIVPPEKISLNLQLFLRLHDHKTEQQESKIVSNEIVGYINQLIINQ